MTRPPAVPATPAAATPFQPRVAATIRSNQLFGAARTVVIEHAGQHYQLRITRENKLILTK